MAHPTSCINNKGVSVPNGMHYAPNGPDDCLLCTCVNWKPVLCRAVLCAPPSCNAVRVKGRCCEWICLDGSSVNSSNFINVNVHNYGPPPVADIGLRLVTSSGGAIFSLCLLFYLIFRLKRREARLQRERRRNLTVPGDEETGNPNQVDGFDDIANAAAGDQPELGYRVWWKPPGFCENRAVPPSYDDAMAAVPSPPPPLPPRFDDCSSESCESEAPPYSSIARDPVIAHPTAANRHLTSLSGATLVLPFPAPPRSQLHHVSTSSSDGGHGGGDDDDQDRGVRPSVAASRVDV